MSALLAPIPGVGCAVWRGDRVLLVRRGKAPRLGEWSIPGGRLEPGETVRGAAHREVREEAGVEIELLGLVDVVDAVSREAGGALAAHYVLIDFAARWVSGEARPGDDAEAVRWVALDEAERLVAWDETRRILRASRRFL